MTDLMGMTAIPLEEVHELVLRVQELLESEVDTCQWVARGRTIEELQNEFGRI